MRARVINGPMRYSAYTVMVFLFTTAASAWWRWTSTPHRRDHHRPDVNQPSHSTCDGSARGSVMCKVWSESFRAMSSRCRESTECSRRRLRRRMTWNCEQLSMMCPLYVQGRMSRSERQSWNYRIHCPGRSTRPRSTTGLRRLSWMRECCGGGPSWGGEPRAVAGGPPKMRSPGVPASPSANVGLTVPRNAGNRLFGFISRAI